MYALGIGFQEDPMNEKHFQFTYEQAANFKAFPTFYHTFAHQNPWRMGGYVSPGLPAFDPMKLLHGEETLEVFKPLTPGSTFIVKQDILDMQDKGSAAILVVAAKIYDKVTNEIFAQVNTSFFIRGIGGFGHKGTYKIKFPATPKRSPDYETTVNIKKNAAFIYRLSSDTNPLHVDPEESKRGGFSVPILHGLCTYGMTIGALQQHFYYDNVDEIKHTGVRFTSHVYPGETLIIHAWQEGNDTIIYQTSTKERGKVVLKGYLKMEFKNAKL